MKQQTCHIVLGAGTSSLLLCHQLLEKDDVILIERGGTKLHDSIEELSNPSKWNATSHTKSAKIHYTEPQQSLNNRIIRYQQGNGVGGTANLNAMILSLGSKRIYETWSEQWQAESLNRYWKEIKLLIHPKLSKFNLSSLFNKQQDVNETIIPNIFDNYYSMIDTNTNKRIDLEELLHSTSRKGKLTILKNSEIEFIDFKIINNKIQAYGVKIKNIDNLITLSNQYSEIFLCCGVFQSPLILFKSISLFLKKYINYDNYSNDISQNIMKLTEFHDNILQNGLNLEDHCHFPIFFIGNWWNFFQTQK